MRKRILLSGMMIVTGLLAGCGQSSEKIDYVDEWIIVTPAANVSQQTDEKIGTGDNSEQESGENKESENGEESESVTEENRGENREHTAEEGSSADSGNTSGEATEAGSGNTSGEATEAGSGNISGEATEAGSGNTSGEATEVDSENVVDEIGNGSDKTDEQDAENPSEKTDGQDAENPSEKTDGQDAEKPIEEVDAKGTEISPKEDDTDDLYFAVREQYAAQQKKNKKLYRKLESSLSQPVINIVTENGKLKTDKEYCRAIIDVFNCEEGYELDEVYAQVKVRGNSSASEWPYPYRIKFEKKHGMLGLHNGKAYKSWVLLKPYWTMCPNFLALNLAKAIFNGEYYVSDSRYVNLYMNGEYQGMYLLCEQNQVAKGRVEVHEPEEGETGLDIGYLIEMDNCPDQKQHPAFALNYHGSKIKDWQGETRKVSSDDYSIISDTWSKEQKKQIEKYLNGVYDVIYQACEKGKAKVLDEEFNLQNAPKGMTCEEAVRAVIDVKSFMNMLILEELVQNFDVGAGSFYMCVDFSEGARYNKLTCTCPWDFNWAYTDDPEKNYYACTWQRIQGNYDRSHIWFILLMKADWFRAELMDYWQEIASSGRLEAALDYVAETIEPCREDLKADDQWRVDRGYRIIKYVKKRIKFLDDSWGKAE